MALEEKGVEARNRWRRPMRRACALLAAAAGALIGVLRLAPLRWAGEGGAALLGEARIRTGSDARRFAAAMHREAASIWADGRRWHTALEGDGARVESIRIDRGPFNLSGVLLTRGAFTIANITAAALYRLLTSPEGFQIIDPLSDPADFSKYKQRYHWARGRLEVAEAHVPLPPPLSPREFCVLNAFDNRRRTFVSKSVQHVSMPGASPFAADSEQPEGRVRALNTFALRAHPLPRAHGASTGVGATLELINYADLVGVPTLMNWVNVQTFLPGIVNRLRARLSETSGNRVNSRNCHAHHAHH